MPRSNIIEDQFDNSGTRLTSTTQVDALKELASNYRIKLTANTDFYVSTSGSNSNEGNSVAPWLTIQYALDYVAANYDLNGFQASINCASGTYNITSTISVPEFINTGYVFCDVVLRGNNNSDTFIDFNTGGTGISIRSNSGTRFCIRAFNFIGTNVTNGFYCSKFAYLDLQSCFFSTGNYTTVIRAEDTSHVDIGFLNFQNITASFAIFLGETFSTIKQVNNINITPGDTVTSPDLLILFGSSTYFVGSGVSFNELGTFTGRKYSITSQSTVQFVDGYAPPYFPGTAGIINPAGIGSINYQNTASGLTADSISGAIDEVNTKARYTLSTEVSGAGTSTAVKNQILLVNSTGARTVNPPVSPIARDRFMVVNSRANSTGGNSITISFATQLRHGSNTNRVINAARGKAEFMYVDATIGWIDID